MKAAARSFFKVLLGETRTLPAALGVAVGATFAIRAAASPAGWWHRAGGFVLLALVICALTISLQRRRGADK